MADFNQNESFELSEYDPNWPVLFQQEADKIAEVMGDDALEIEHIGSTSIPGLSAKPIIDILLVVEELGPVETYQARLEPLGYHAFAHADFNKTEHLFLWKGEPRTHHLHIVEYATWEHQRQLIFRDYLRRHPEVAKQYESVKRELAVAFKAKRPAYTKGKTAFIKSILAYALEEIANPSLRLFDQSDGTDDQSPSNHNPTPSE